MGATVRGVFYELSQSTYRVTNGELVLYFSSKVYMRKFMERYKEERALLEKRLVDKYETGLNMNIISDIALYRRIEKRGQYGTVKGVGMKWQELDQYALRRLTVQNTLDWQETLRQK